MFRPLSLAVLALCCAAPATRAQTPHAPTGHEHRLFTPAELQWSAGPASLPTGAHATVLEGNPANEGPFTIRLRLPDGYRIPPHWHPGIEHVTVLSGVFVVGRGERASAEGVTELPQGGFMLMPPRTPHHAVARGETVVQLHGMGPWSIHYVNAADDPRKSTP